MDRRVIFGLIPLVISSYACAEVADSYVKLSVGGNRIEADKLKFHNPNGVGLTSNATSGGYILLNNVSGDDGGRSISLKWGYPFSDSNIRLEMGYTKRGEVSFTGTAAFGGRDFLQEINVKSDSLMLFGYYDFLKSEASSFYVGLGVGAAFNKAKGYQGRNLGGLGYFPGKESTNLAWGAALGYSAKISDNISFDVEYNYIDLGEANTGTTDASFAALGMNPNERLESDLFSQEVTVGIRILY